MNKGSKRLNGRELAELHSDKVIALRAEGLGFRMVSRELRDRHGIEVSADVVKTACRRLGLHPGYPTGKAPAGYMAPPPPPKNPRPPMAIEDRSEPVEDQPIEELIADRVAAFRRYRSKSNQHRRTLAMPCEPFGIYLAGDPHLDDDGCAIETLYEHVRLVQETPGVVAACVGDVQNHWIGRLGRKYGDQSSTVSQGWRLSEWFLGSMDWLALVGGNHDAWASAGGGSIDPYKLICKDAKVRAYAPDELRIRLTWQGRPDLEPLIWVLRHDFPGRSWFHTSHGPNKAAMLDGKAHLFTCGHLHSWGQLSSEQPHGRVTHAVRVRGYKFGDDYAMTKGFTEQHHGEACLIVVNPEATEPGRITIFWDLETGCDYLTAIRGGNE